MLSDLISSNFSEQGEVSYHSKRTPGDLFFEFGRVPQWNCPIAGKHDESGPAKRPTPKPAAKSATAWFVPPIQVEHPRKHSKIMLRKF